MKKRFQLITVLVTSCIGTVGAQPPETLPGEILVQFKAGASATGKGKALGRVRGQAVDNLIAAEHRKDGRGDLVLVRHPKNITPEQARLDLEADPDVEFAEPNYVYVHQASSTDTYYSGGSLWGMYGPGTVPANIYGSNAAAAWADNFTGAASVYVGIIDEGIQFNHPDLNGQVWTNPYDPVDGIDNDGNGYKDDIHGWDFDGNNNTIYDGGTRGNLDDHGTHVAGTIGAKANGSGVVGVNWNVTLISGKFLGSRGGTSANAIKALNYFVDLKTRHNLNIVATNNSWGGGGYSQALFDAINRANTAGILFIAAAGNAASDNDRTASYPSNYNLPNVIAVAAITSTGGLASFSNYGATTVDLGAPGAAIWSTTAFNLYSNYNGTSMATPHVTGAAALYASVHPGATVAQIRDALLGSAVATPALAGKCVTGGRLDTYGALFR